MSKFWKIVGIAALVAVVGAAALGVAVYAQGPTPPEPLGWVGDYFEQMYDAIASKLGVERAELDAVVQEARQEMIERAVAEGHITQEQADRLQSRVTEGFGLRAFPARRLGHRKAFCGGDGLQEMANVVDVLAEQLGLTVDELVDELQEGKTLSELAEEKGVELQDVRIEIAKDRIQRAVEEGSMTQEQADWLTEGLEQGFVPMGPIFGQGRGGRFGGLRGRRTP